ncbi:VOC family protein [Rossellomorea sp. RS05]|uniref:VOC family protein n=1 Tax=Rossellomorea sp. RS05 TaxID=3149166 RepID=UPI003221C256
MKIHQLELFIGNYEETVAFYQDTMGFTCRKNGEGSTDMEVGRGIMTFHKKTGVDCYYHFALNIPFNLFDSAKAYMAERVTLAREDDEDEVFFKESKARSFYFLDPAGNIVEFIAREGVNPDSEAGSFSPSEVLGISEIGISSEEVYRCSQEVEAKGIPVRNDRPLSNGETLNFMGEAEDGVFIIIARAGRRWIFSDKNGLPAPTIVKTDRGTMTFHLSG